MRADDDDNDRQRRKDYREHVRECLCAAAVPTGLHDGLVAYLADRRRPGDFLLSVLRNDLREAAQRADPFNRMRLAEIVMFLNMYAPEPAWGSPAAVEAWLADESPAPMVFE